MVFLQSEAERATYELIPVIYITSSAHQDHNNINPFRKQFLKDIKDLLSQILLWAHALGALQLGDVSLDGTKIHANASKHRTLSCRYANRLEEQLWAEVDELLKKPRKLARGTSGGDEK